MPRDRRLYMTFPIDFHRHPKVTRLAPEVRWTFVEMNGEARIAKNDGVFLVDEAEFMWPAEHLAALAASHPTKPLLTTDGERYTIRDYAEHQFTEADREELSRKRSEAGAKGGKARANAKHLLSNPEQTQAESESESGDSTKTHMSQSLDTRARDSTDSFEVSEVTALMASRAGIADLAVVERTIRSKLGLRLDAYAVMAVAAHLIGKAKTYPDAPDRYVLSCIENSPAEVEKFIHASGFAA